MIILLTVIHVIVCVFMVIVVLLQSGKSADIAGTFGGAGSQTAFGPRGAATALSKATTIAVIIFMLTSIGLSVLESRHSSGGGSVLEKVTPGSSQPAQSPAPVPAPAPAQQQTPAQQQPAPAQPKK